MFKVDINVDEHFLAAAHPQKKKKKNSKLPHMKQSKNPWQRQKSGFRPSHNPTPRAFGANRLRTRFLQTLCIVMSTLSSGLGPAVSMSRLTFGLNLVEIRANQP
jgi:hypothetical protein